MNAQIYKDASCCTCTPPLIESRSVRLNQEEKENAAVSKRYLFIKKSKMCICSSEVGNSQMVGGGKQHLFVMLGVQVQILWKRATSSQHLFTWQPTATHFPAISGNNLWQQDWCLANIQWWEQMETSRHARAVLRLWHTEEWWNNIPEWLQFRDRLISFTYRWSPTDGHCIGSRCSRNIWYWTMNPPDPWNSSSVLHSTSTMGLPTCRGVAHLRCAEHPKALKVEREERPHVINCAFINLTG